MSSTAVAETVTTDAAVSFNALAKQYWRDLYSYAYRLSGNRHTAEDLVQESLVRAWRSLDKLQNPKAIKGWLLTIVRRENARRFERYQPQESDVPTEEIGARRKTYDTSTEAFVLRRAIRELPPEYRDPLVLQVIHGYSQKEIAEKLGLTPAGVGTRLFRARHRLREAVGEMA
ncbi:MAG: sigma-70 family RNA polymerase sigma factor [Pseudomonadota bacterium]|nr:sigma-70 family RNA polymerase sigma factor [Pseudomonadota bacterium]